MFSVKVNKSDPTDLYEQVAAEIRRAIAEGEAKPGERLPPARTSPPSSASTPTPCCARCGCCATKGSLSSAAAAASRSPGRPSAARSSNGRRTRPLRREQGYRVDELVEIIEDVG